MRRTGMRLKRWQMAGLVLAATMAVLVVAGILLKPVIREQVNGFRSERLMAQAEAAFAEENWESAARQGRAAHYLAPERQAPKVLLARALLRQRLSTAVDWWRLVVDDPTVPVEDLRQITELLLMQDQRGEGLDFLARLVERDGRSDATRRLWLRGLAIQHRYGSALALSREFVEDGSADWEIHRTYLQLLDQVKGPAGRPEIAGHLTQLAESGGAMAVRAARDLVALDFAEPDTRIRAARLLQEAGTSPMDHLYGRGLLVQSGEADFSSLEPALEELLRGPEQGMLERLLVWSHWMGDTSWFADRVDWSQYRANGGNYGPWLQMLMDQGDYDRVLALTESVGAHAGGEKATLLYCRSMAFQRLGQPERAKSVLSLAAQTFAPEELPQLEALLAQEGHWRLLADLHERQARESRRSPRLVYKLLLDHYHLGNQMEVVSLLGELRTERPQTLAGHPTEAGFIAYLRMVAEGVDNHLHAELESLLAKEPEVLDFRLLAGLSHLLGGRPGLAREFLEGIPEISPDAPRHLRVAAILLGAPDALLLSMSEQEQLLARERMLLSRAQEEVRQSPGG